MGLSCFEGDPAGTRHGRGSAGRVGLGQAGRMGRRRSGGGVRGGKRPAAGVVWAGWNPTPTRRPAGRPLVHHVPSMVRYRAVRRNWDRRPCGFAREISIPALHIYLINQREKRGQ